MQDIDSQEKTRQKKQHVAKLIRNNPKIEGAF